MCGELAPTVCLSEQAGDGRTNRGRLVFLFFKQMCLSFVTDISELKERLTESASWVKMPIEVIIYIKLKGIQIN